MVKTFSALNDPGVVKIIKAGKVGVIPTDTIYGLVALAGDPKASKKVLDIKGRKHKPGTMIAASIDQLVDLGIKKRYLSAVGQFWPGAVSVVLPMPSQLYYLHSGIGTLPVRIPANNKILRLISQTGPLITTSANLPDQTPAHNIVEAKAYFNGNVDYYVDGGDIVEAEPSTIIRVVDDAIEILRQGAVKIDENGRIADDI